MSKFTKITAAIALVVASLTVLLFVLAKIVITPERIKQTVLPIAESSLQRKIDMGAISVSIFSGIELHDLTIYESDGLTVFMKTDQVQLQYQFLPLLAMKVVVDEVRINNPEIRIVRSAEGRLNVDDFIGDDNETSSPAKTSKQSESMGVSLLVSKAIINNGRLVFEDHTIHEDKPHVVVINELEFAAKGISLTGEIPVNLSCQISQSSLEVEGSISLNEPRANFEIKLKDLDALVFEPYFKEPFPGEVAKLPLKIESTLKASPGEVVAGGVLETTAASISLALMPGQVMEDIQVLFEYDLYLDINSGSLNVRRGYINFNGITGEAAGTLQNIFGQPSASVTFRTADINLEQAVQTLPRALTKNILNLKPKGSVQMSAELDGTLDEPKKLLRQATIDLKDVQVAAQGKQPSIKGQLRFVDDILASEDLKVSLGDNHAQLNLSVRNPFGDLPIVDADIFSKKFDLASLLYAGGAAGVAAQQEQSASTNGYEVGPINIPVKAKGTIEISSAFYKDLVINDFMAQFHLQDDLLVFSFIKGKVAGGSFNNKAKIDLGVKGLSYSATMGLKEIQAKPVLKTFLPKADNFLDGVMDLDLDVKGRGIDWKTISKQITGQGEMLVADGQLTSPKLVKGLASFLALSQLKEIAFQNFKGDVKIIDGKLLVDSNLVGDDFKIAPKGTIGLDGSINLSMVTLLSPDMAGRIGSGRNVTKYFTNNEGWVQVPLQITGNYESPKFGLDPRGVEQQARQALGKELNRQINKLLKPQQQTDQERSDSESGSQESPTNKLLQESLKQLFGQ